jgi:Kef-type K+ transport system membrane component KefB
MFGEPEFIYNLGIIILAAVVFSLGVRVARVPAIVAYIVAGLALGPVTGVVELSHAMELIAEVGIALLLFLVGLELSFDKVKSVGKVAVAAGIGQVVFTAAGGFVVSWLLGFDLMEALFLATALTFSSTVVVVKLLDQKGDLNSLYGRIAVGIFLVQDIVVIVALTFLAGLGATETVDLGQTLWGLGKAFGGMTLLLGVVLVASRYLLPRPFAWAARSPETIFIWSLCWCFVIVTGAEVMELSLEIGAFIAGLSLAQLPYNEDLRRRVHPLMNFFIAIFFVTLGIQMEFGAALDQWIPVVVLSLFVLIGNPFIFMLIIARMGYGEKTSFFTSVTVAQISEFSFIFAAMGVGANLIDASILSIVAVVGVVTIGASAYMILYSEPLYRFVRRFGLLRPFKAAQEDEVEERLEREGHVIVVGMNALGREIVRRLCQGGERVLAIDTDPGKLEGLPCETMLGNVEYLAVLEDAGLAHCRLVVSALQIEDTNDLLTYRARSRGIPCAVHAFDLSLADELVELGAQYLMTPQVDGIRMQIEELKRRGFVNG